MTHRAEILQRLAIAVGFRYPLRWADERTTLGDYEGRDLTIEVFNIPSARQRGFFHEIRQHRRELQEMLGRPVTFVFHTPEVTKQYYSHLFAEVHGAEITGALSIELEPGGVGERPEIQGQLRVPMELAA
jgi:hypothetical protein